MKSPLSLLRPFLLCCCVAPALAVAQDRGSLDLAQIDGGMPTLAAAPPDTPAGLPTAPSPARGTPVGTPAPGTIRLNFKDAALSDVLNYLSSTAGFIITQEVPVSGTVNVVSQQAMTPDEAVDLLNTLLDSKGYVAIRNGRILKIVARQGAATRDLPVVTGADPAAIPRKDNMVTQILPVRYVPVGKLVDNLRPLLSADASISSNDSSNAVILTDTQTNIHRMAEIIRALDTSVSSISLIRVYTLRYADAKGLADVVTQLFSPNASASNSQQQNGRPNFGFPFFGGGNRGGGNQQQQQPAQPESAAMQAASRVVAVADETTNSVVVSAPDEYMSAIADIVEKLDTNTTEVTDTQIFKLQHADATELAASLTTLYSDDATANNSGNNNRGGNNNNRGFQGQPQPGAANAQSERALLQARVIAVADPRTNSVLINASHASMAQIALLVGRLDASDSKKQHIYVHTLAHADPSNVAYILNGMFSVSGSAASDSSNPQPTDSRLRTRSANGLTTEAQNSIGGGTTSSSSGSRSSSGLR